MADFEDSTAPTWDNLLTGQQSCGMAAQVPIKGDNGANVTALQRVRDDKLREVRAGHDGTWVAHPALVPLAREVFDAHMPSANQHDVLRKDVHITRDDLLRNPRGSITRTGFDGNVEVCVRYLAAWLDDNGCVPIHHLMEDAATAEIARAQLWQWLHYGDGGERQPLHLDDGSPIDWVLFECVLLNLPGRLGDRALIHGVDKLDEAIALIERLTRSDVLEEFLTVPAYDHID